jgi:Fe-S-cluster containining protein
MRAYLLGGRPIHFPFLSGILDYECSTCSAPCCKGGSLGIGRSNELVTLTRVQPSIALFMSPGFAASTMLSVATPLEACWFLDKHDACRLHKAGGPEAKPSGCRLFPFQRLRSVGEAVAVLPDLLCPLRTSQGPSDSGKTSHDEIALQMHRAGVPRGGHAPLPPPRDMAWREALPLERRIVDAAEHHLEDEDYLAYASAQARLTSKATLAAHERKDGAARARATIERFLGVSRRPSAAAVHDLVALTGTLRLLGSTLPRRELPAMLVALSVLCGEYEGMQGARWSARTVTSLFEQRLPLLYVLSHLADRPMVKDPEEARRLISRLPAVRAPLLAVLESMVDNRELTVAETLEDILRQQGKTFASPLGTDAVTMLHGLGRVLMRTGMFVPV